MLLKQLARPASEYLVYTSAGDKANLTRWLSRDRHFDIWITYYGDTAGRYLDVADYLDARKGSKFQNLRHVYRTWGHLVQPYQAVFVMDDDVLLDGRAIDELFRIREQSDYWVLQPAFSPWGKISHEITRVRRHCRRRHTNFVEMTCPLFRRDVLDRFMAVYDPAVAGWGVDWWFLHLLGPDLRGHVAVIDEIPCTNPRDRTKGGREIDRLQSAEQRRAAWKRIKNRDGIADAASGQVEYERLVKPPLAALAGILWSVTEAAAFAAIGTARRAWWTVRRSLSRVRRRVRGVLPGRSHPEPPRGVDVFRDLRKELPSYRAAVIFDVGAHHGESARGFAGWAPTARIYCFEPVGESYARLLQATRDLGGVVCERIALGSTRGEGWMSVGAASDRNALLVSGAETPPRDEPGTSERTRVETVVGFCAEHGVDAISFLKIDTEGHDLDVLKGAEELLRRQAIDFVQVEAGMNPENTLHVPLERFKEYLEPLGYFMFGVYEQFHEWPTRRIHLRRVNALFVSRAVVETAVARSNPSARPERLS